MRRYRGKLAALLLAVLSLCTHAAAQTLPAWLTTNCLECAARMTDKTGVYILEKGEESLLGRAWLTQNATQTIDVQYFIWSSDNIGTLAAEQLLSAAERGVRVRVLVDDTLIDAQDKTLLLLSAHPNAIFVPSGDQLTPYTVSYVIGTDICSDFLATSQT